MNGDLTQLRPSLWRTCRVISCETRLRLLWALFDEKELSVSELARRTGMGDAQASVQLRVLNARGLIRFRREKMRVLYRAKANETVDFAPQLVKGLRVCHERNMAFFTVMRQSTAFTHQRRIEISRILSKGALDSEQLLRASGMSSSALFLHIGKLTSRGFIEKSGGKYRLSAPANRFGKVLLRAALA
jgi:DNA-binding transcriptional ArsR family regulator